MVTTIDYLDTVARCRELGARVRYFRELKGFSQEELGSRANLHRTYIGRVERGESNVGTVSIFKIAYALQIEISELFNGKIGEKTGLQEDI